MIFDFTTNVVRCKHCGYVRPDEIGQLYADGDGAPRRKPRPHVPITFDGEAAPGVLSAFETGLEAYFAGDRRAALKAFQRAASYQSEFVDAHVWAAKSADDVETRRHHLEYALAYDPDNGEALRMMLVLQGRLTPEQAARSAGDSAPILKTAAGPVQTTTTVLNCPQCAGRLTVVNERVVCHFCGYTALRPQPGGAEAELLNIALMKRKSQTVRWDVGQRLVVCNQCGAEHTLTATALSNHCRFCGSTQVILSDALQSFEQPDGLLPFTVTPAQAEALIQRQLDSLGQRLANLFNTNRVAQTSIEGIYAPYWVFDVVVEVRRARAFRQSGLPMTTSYTDKDMMFGVAVPAVKSPPPAALRQILPFDLDALLPYEPRWLAQIPAQLYSLDFERASLDAREIVAEAMRRKHDDNAETTRFDERGEQYTETTWTHTRIESMIFQLVLLPVWIATLTEVDGDIRLALVNGQTGKVVFGRTIRKR